MDDLCVQDLEDIVDSTLRTSLTFSGDQVVSVATIINLFVKPCTLFLKSISEHLSFFPYRLAAHTYIGFRVGDACLRGFPIAFAKLLNKEKSILRTLPPGTAFADLILKLALVQICRVN